MDVVDAAAGEDAVAADVAVNPAVDVAIAWIPGNSYSCVGCP